MLSFLLSLLWCVHLLHCSSPAASSQPVQLNPQTCLAAVQGHPAPAVSSFNLSTISFMPYSHTQNISWRAIRALLSLQLSLSPPLLQVSQYLSKVHLYFLSYTGDPSFVAPCSVPPPPPTQLSH